MPKTATHRGKGLVLQMQTWWERTGMIERMKKGNCNHVEEPELLMKEMTMMLTMAMDSKGEETPIS
jgi:hypothetical protein